VIENFKDISGLYLSSKGNSRPFLVNLANRQCISGKPLLQAASRKNLSFGF